MAISDVFDALRSKRAYRPSFEIPTIVGFLKEGAGKDFNPALVDNFIATLKRIKVL